tara:strand:- start:1093 stop:1290 length:198 start_codon:yes stop_codon:yes gene_type:complete
MSKVIEHRANSTVLTRCPQCDSRSIGAHHGEFILSFAWQETFCNDCGAEWVEVYQHIRQEEQVVG